MSLEIKCYPKGMYGENTYLISDEATGFKAVIDPGYYDMEVRFDIQNNAYLKYLLLTHAHHDHFLCAKQYLEEYSSVVFRTQEEVPRSTETPSAGRISPWPTCHTGL